MIWMYRHRSCWSARAGLQEIHYHHVLCRCVFDDSDSAFCGPCAAEVALGAVRLQSGSTMPEGTSPVHICNYDTCYVAAATSAL